MCKSLPKTVGPTLVERLFVAAHAVSTTRLTRFVGSFTVLYRGRNIPVGSIRSVASSQRLLGQREHRGRFNECDDGH